MRNNDNNTNIDINSNNNMTIFQFIELTNNLGVSAVITAKKYLNLLNIKNKISSLLNDCGIYYNQKTKQWEQGREDKGITENMTFEEFVEINNLSDKYKFKGTQEPKSNTKSNTPIFTNNEIEKLKAIIKLYDVGLLNPMGEVATTLEDSIDNRRKKIQEAINQLPRSTKKIRKTYSISESVVKDLDKFANKRGLKLSDCIELAINDLVKNYK